ncbi:MAG: diacylglycerol kinase family protein [Candidatus Neomarinimicrobiota bacterium]
MKRKYAIIVNPTAGRGKTAKVLPHLQEVTRKQDAVFEYYIMEYPFHAPTPFGIIPNGTGNDFAKCIGVSKNVEQAVKTLMQYDCRVMDLGTIGDRLFLNGVGIGFDGYVNYRSKSTRLFRGVLSYYITVLTSLARWRAIPVQIEIDDGSFDICHVRDIPIWKILLNLGRLKTGTLGVVKEVNIQKGKTINVKSEYPLPIHFDGEVYDINAKEVRVSIVPNSAMVIGEWNN